MESVTWEQTANFCSSYNKLFRVFFFLIPSVFTLMKINKVVSLTTLAVHIESEDPHGT